MTDIAAIKRRAEAAKDSCSFLLPDGSNKLFRESQADIPALLTALTVARQDALREAAKVADDCMAFWKDEADAFAYDAEASMRCLARRGVAANIAHHIRALAEKDVEP